MNVIRSRAIVGLMASTLLASGLTVAAVVATSAGSTTAAIAGTASAIQPCSNATQIDACARK
jgi:hypothetical protein